jgi:hypothetical protein
MLALAAFVVGFLPVVHGFVWSLVYYFACEIKCIWSEVNKYEMK